MLDPLLLMVNSFRYPGMAFARIKAMIQTPKELYPPAVAVLAESVFEDAAEYQISPMPAQGIFTPPV
ncbi:MAG: hypothetical protein LBH95_04865 [Oscillospiraceae bacterium]|jgi:hypothetical protein|nr:hypothetical protein [Oscillospiraceae bacterium]